MQRKIARENAFILIFESICKKDETAQEIFDKATEIRGLDADEYVTTVFFGAYENSDRLDEAMEKHLKGWKKERISPVSLAILRLGCYEIMFMADIPSKVSINEAIELSKKFDDEKSYTFINGVLNAVASDYSEGNE
ncbi:MAG: transcription antitermination factor NusB [Clostridia bacterium]|nr:transcription antitermination factor NusB [Clostridia bacterium]